MYKHLTVGRGLCAPTCHTIVGRGLCAPTCLDMSNKRKLRENTDTHLKQNQVAKRYKA